MTIFEMKWLDVQRPECILCGARGANVFLQVNNYGDESHICFSCCAQIYQKVIEKNKE
jgi:hypothetical protein